jgi:hypothetical protein
MRLNSEQELHLSPPIPNARLSKVDWLRRLLFEDDKVMTETLRDSVHRRGGRTAFQSGIYVALVIGFLLIGVAVASWAHDKTARQPGGGTDAAAQSTASRFAMEPVVPIASDGDASAGRQPLWHRSNDGEVEQDGNHSFAFLSRSGGVSNGTKTVGGSHESSMSSASSTNSGRSGAGAGPDTGGRHVEGRGPDHRNQPAIPVAAVPETGRSVGLFGVGLGTLLALHHLLGRARRASG